MYTGLLCVVLALSGKALSRNVPQENDEERIDTPPSNFVGEGTNELATTLLQGFVGEEKDFVFSPLGYSVVLAILAEGARGRSRNQLVEALQLPEDTYAVRQNYKAILESMREHWTLNKPEFKNWFYVYKNYSVNDAYKKVLLEYYLTEVKNVKKVHYELNFEENEDSEDENKDNEHKGEDNKNDDLLAQEKNGENKEGTKEGVLKKKGTIVHAEPSKTDSKARNFDSKEEGTNEKENPILDSFEASKDVTSALTANRILDRDSQELDSETKMIIFNGFYFRGKWKTPFKLTKEDEKRSFYKSVDEKKKVSMMQTSGLFDIGDVPELDAVALELPYEGDQYSMLVLLPNEKDGLTKLMSDLAGFSLNRVYKYLINKPVNVLLPKYQIQTISHPETILQKAGITDIFTSDADLTGISSDNLRMGALVQLVNVFVDEDSADTNSLTAMAIGDSKISADKFVADHPFLFFIRDQTKNVLVAAGKVIDPTFENDQDLAP